MEKILVIDDESQIRKLIRQMLEQNGYEVSDACDKQKGIDSFRQNPTDVVIIDLLLSQREAIETIVELKRFFMEVAIIIMSRDNETIDNEKLLAFTKPFGAVSVLAKPFKQDDLLNAIESTLLATNKCQEES